LLPTSFLYILLIFVSAGLEGSTIIRAFRKEQKFSSTFNLLVDNNSSAMLNFLSAQRWLGLRIEVLGTSVSFVACLIIVCANDILKIPAGLVGLMIQWSVIFTAALNFFFLRLSESEARLTSIERIHRTTELPQEAAWETDPHIEALDASWPSRGELVFDDVSMRYRKELPLALESMSFKLSPGTRCGVVGRTGAGKTSLTACLFRVVEVESGRIMLDGVDLAKIGLSDVRGRSNGMRVIPQDPVLYSGTLRDCLDPFKQCSDDYKILEALQAVNHKGALDRGIAVLNETVEEGGSNMSIGERQLLCLARVIVEEPRVLVLDEATASVDTMTDTCIQKMLRTRFKNTTMLTIAHRLHTIMDYDNVLVLDNGRVAEFGPPRKLLENPEGVFTCLVEATGPEAAELRAIAIASGKTERSL
jgi:ABC-type multidrug transport system fused ATPase/permease subunit